MRETSLDERLACRVALERQARGWTVAELAARSGVSRPMIAKIEQGSVRPTASLLGRLSGALGLPLSLLLARVEEQPSRLSRRDRQVVWRDPRTRYRRRSISPASDPLLQLTEIALPPGARVMFPAAAYAFVHHQIWVLEGRLQFTEGEETHDLRAGDCLALGEAVDCAYHNPASRTCRYLVVVSKR